MARRVSEFLSTSSSLGEQRQIQKVNQSALDLTLTEVVQMRQMELSAEGVYTFVPNVMEPTAFSSMVVDYPALWWKPYQLILHKHLVITVIMQHKSQQILMVKCQQ